MVGSGVLGNVVSGFGGEDGDEEDVVRIEMVKVMLYREVETGDVVFDGNIGRVAGDEHIVGVVNGDGGFLKGSIAFESIWEDNVG